MPKKDIIIKLKYLQRTRHLMCRHDGAALAPSLLMQKKLRTAQITEKVSYMSPLG